ncbi:hypothetical protein FJ955_02090 [Mesorhizobium sp. B2-2-2]|uniref:hypothetical protein n=1 Tax=Mesorhizobium sp. B2-2-2 TaxID=2589964 RepID=UPI0011271042|nr:hypothetical protein [Mesorhizobium sp. B2-2-2]TPM33562.1 hypothetical protein FJ955_02090 [Mesorhizobium sp. B2-2-2]
MLITIDIPPESIASFQALCSEHGIEVRGCDEQGPAGGNPRYRIAVHSASALAALGKYYWG